MKKNKRKKDNIMLPNIGQMTQNKETYSHRDSPFPKKHTRYGINQKYNLKRNGEINVANLVRRGISRRNTQIGKKSSS
jgi:hypothetical protein